MWKILIFLICLFPSVVLATTSTVDPTIPVEKSSMSSSVIRGNFLATYNDLNTLFSRTASYSNWNTAYGWGNHASAGYLTALTATGASPLTLTATGSSITGSLLQSSATQNGYLSAIDWGTFNSKLSGNQTITLSGDLTGTGATSLATTLANTATARTNLGLGAASNVTFGGLIASTATLTTLYTATATANSNNTLAATTAYADGQAACDGGVLLATVTASNSATISFTGYMTSTYKSYTLKLYNILPATTATDLLLRVGAGGSYYNTNYEFHCGGSIHSSENSFNLDDAISSTASNGGLSGTIKIFNPSNTVSPKGIFSQTLAADTNSSNNSESLNCGGRYYGAVTAITDVQLLFSSDNVTSGTAYLCGMKY